MRSRLVTIALLVASLVATPVLAQQRVVTPDELRAAMAAKAATDAERRALVTSVLRDDEMRAIAARLSLDITAAERAVATLDATDLERAAAAAAAIQHDRAGAANTVTLSVTTLLLIIIIVILLA